MKKQKYFLGFVLLLALAGVGCSHNQHVVESQVDRDPASDKKSASIEAYLNTDEFATEASKKLMAMTSGTFEQGGKVPKNIAQHLEDYQKSDELNKLLNAYSTRLYEKLKIDSKSPDAQKNFKRYFPVVAQGISNYVGDSGESDADTGPSWQDINDKYRNGKAFTKVESQFNEQILKALPLMPWARGLAFRGIRGDAKFFDQTIPEQGLWLQKAYTSTSLDPQVAFGFAGSSEQFYSGIMIIKQCRSLNFGMKHLIINWNL